MKKCEDCGNDYWKDSCLQCLDYEQEECNLAKEVGVTLAYEIIQIKERLDRIENKLGCGKPWGY